MGKARDYSARAEDDTKKSGVFTMFLLGTDEKYYQPDDERNDKSSKAYDKDFAAKVVEKKTIHTAFYEACTGDKMLLDGPQGVRSPGRIQQMVDVGSEAVKNFIATSEPDKTGKYTINLAGFSRGGACCTRLANKLQDMLDQGELKDKNGKVITLNEINVNICASDPVPGLIDKGDKDVKTIPPIVKTYVATLQLNERRTVFIPEDLSRVKVVDPLRTQVTFLPLQGNHAETNKVKIADVKHCTLLHYDIKFAFFNRFGSTFRNNQMPFIAAGGNDSIVDDKDRRVQSPQTILEYYALAKDKKEIYSERGMTNGIGPREERSFVSTYKEDYVKDTFFMNQHERELFKQLYPKSFNHFFEKGASDPNDKSNTGGVYDEKKNPQGGYSKKELHEELQKMERQNPNLMRKLEEAGKIFSGFGASTYAPRLGGITAIEPCRLLSTLSGNEPKPLTMPEILRMNFSENMFSLKREKNDDKNFKIGMDIRKKIDDIIHTAKPDDEKFGLMMEVLTNEVQALAKAKNKPLVNVINNAINYVTAAYEMPKGQAANENELAVLHQMHSAGELQPDKVVAKQVDRVQQLHKLSRMCTAIEFTDSPVISRASSTSHSAANDETKMEMRRSARLSRSSRQAALARQAGMESVLIDTLASKDKVATNEALVKPDITPPSSPAIKLRGN